MGNGGRPGTGPQQCMQLRWLYHQPSSAPHSGSPHHNHRRLPRPQFEGTEGEYDQLSQMAHSALGTPIGREVLKSWVGAGVLDGWVGVEVLDGCWLAGEWVGVEVLGGWVGVDGWG